MREGNCTSLRFRKDKKLIREVTCAQSRALHHFNFFANISSQGSLQKQLQMHLQSGQGCTELMRRICEKALLYCRGFAQLRKKAVESIDNGCDFGRCDAAVERAQISR